MTLTYSGVSETEAVNVWFTAFPRVPPCLPYRLLAPQFGLAGPAGVGIRAQIPDDRRRTPASGRCRTASRRKAPHSIARAHAAAHLGAGRPDAKYGGTMWMKQNVVITIGRSRANAACTAASNAEAPFHMPVAGELPRSRMAFLHARPDEHHEADLGEQIAVHPAERKTPAKGATIRTSATTRITDSGQRPSPRTGRPARRIQAWRLTRRPLSGFIRRSRNSSTLLACF